MPDAPTRTSRRTAGFSSRHEASDSQLTGTTHAWVRDAGTAVSQRRALVDRAYPEPSLQAADALIRVVLAGNGARAGDTKDKRDRLSEALGAWFHAQMAAELAERIG